MKEETNTSTEEVVKDETTESKASDNGKETPAKDVKPNKDEDTKTVDLSMDAKNISVILGAVKDNPSLMNDPQIAAVVKMAQGEKPTEEKKDDKKGESVDGGKGDEDIKKEDTKKEDTKKEDTKKEDTKKDDTKKESVFFKKGTKPENIEFKDLPQALDYIKDKYSIDEINKFFVSVDGWRKGAQDNSKVQNELEDIQDAFSKMPEPIFNAFQAWSEGKEWKVFMENAANLDYESNFDDYETFDIVNHYFPSEFKKEDFTDTSDDPTAKRAVKMAEKQYDIDKKAFQKQRADILDAAKDRQKILATSTDGSVDNLKKTFPDLDKDALKKVKEIMVGGEVTALFFNKDGSYTDNAATKVALVLFGESEIGKAEDRLTKSQEALKDTVSKGSDSPKVKTGQSQQTQVPEQVTKMFADVFEKRYY